MDEPASNPLPVISSAVERSDAAAAHSLKQRYLLKLSTNLFGFGVGIGTQALVPRALGPAAFGDFSFLTSFFQQAVGFLNMNSSSAFYTRLAQRQHDAGLVVYYFFLTIVIGALLGLATLLGLAADLRTVIWPGQQNLFIALGAAWAFLTFVITVLSDMADAYGLTVRAELVKMSVKMAGLMLIALLFWQHWLSLGTYFLFHFAVLIASAWLIIRVLQSGRATLPSTWRLTRDQRNGYSREFSAFCMPLFVFSCISVIEGILDRWLLQRFSGSVQQGFFGLAYQIGAICFLFASAMIPLIMREYAIAFGKQDIESMGRVFMRSTPVLHAIVTYFSCFLAVESRSVLLLFGGQAYADAVVPLTIMCFFPIFQAHGQINASLYFATNRTIEYRNIGIALTIFSLPLTLFLLGPREYGALQAGATGLATKTLFITIVSVSVQFWYNARLMNLSFKRLLGHQVVVLAVFTSLSLVCSFAAHRFFGHLHFLVQFFVSGLCYTAAVACVGVTFPWLFALRREDLAGILAWRGKTERAP